MIRYRIGCDNGHEFEAWFDSIASFESQASEHMVSCPTCASTEIARLPMAPAVVSSRSKAAAPAKPTTTKATTHPSAVVRELRERIMSETTDVGPKFAEEVRSMHFGEKDTRPIRGEASGAELKGLVEDDIPFGIVPPLPEDNN